MGRREVGENAVSKKKLYYLLNIYSSTPQYLQIYNLLLKDEM